jgi:hypothetical protein
VRAGEIQLETINTRILTAFDNLDPRVPVVFLHNRRNQNPIRILILAPLKLPEPVLDRPVADDLDVFPAHDFSFVVGVKFAVTRSDVDHLGCVEADGLRDDSAPALAESAMNDVQVRPRADWTR